MAIDREATLKNAEKFLRVGRLDAAITEYARVVDDQPRDWTTANTLGDLYLRAKQPERAVALYLRIADQLRTEGFLPKAAALYKKVLKITPDDEAVQLHLGEISVRQGLLADAKAYLGAVANRRRQRDDAAGADEMVMRMASIDPSDLSARLAGARAMERVGDMSGAAALYRELYDDYNDKDRPADAAAVLQDCMRCDPSRRDADVLVPLAAVELRADRLDSARALLGEALIAASACRERIMALAWSLADSNVEAAALCVDAVADSWVAAGRYAEAAAVLREFAGRVPAQTGTLLRLVEVSVDGGLESTMYEAQAQLADAYLAAGRAEEARVIAEDLVTREPEEISHIERLRSALTTLGVEDVESAIAARIAALGSEPVELFEDVPADPVPPVSELGAESFSLSTGSLIAAEDLVAPRHEGAPARPVSTQPPAESPGPAEVDLTTLLGDLEGQPIEVPTAASAARPAPDLEDVFAAMRFEAAAGVDADESEEHLALARYYLELGQAEEAVEPLQIAWRSPRHRFTAAAMLGEVFRDQSDLPRAIEWFEQAVESPAPSPDEGRAVLYDLGDVLEAMGETSRALAVFLELAADAPDFRDVRRRVTNLSSAEMEG